MVNVLITFVRITKFELRSAPAGMVIEPVPSIGATVGLLDVMLKVKPPVLAGRVNSRKPVTTAPPWTLFELRVIPDMSMASTKRVPCFVCVGSDCRVAITFRNELEVAKPVVA